MICGSCTEAVAEAYAESMGVDEDELGAMELDEAARDLGADIADHVCEGDVERPCGCGCQRAAVRGKLAQDFEAASRRGALKTIRGPRRGYSA